MCDFILNIKKYITNLCNKCKSKRKYSEEIDEDIENPPQQIEILNKISSLETILNELTFRVEQIENTKVQLKSPTWIEIEKE